MEWDAYLNQRGTHDSAGIYHRIMRFICVQKWTKILQIKLLYIHASSSYYIALQLYLYLIIFNKPAVMQRAVILTILIQKEFVEA